MYNFNQFNNPYNHYYNPNPYTQQSQQNVLPQQQIIQVNGKASVDSIAMSPNSSILLMDSSAPIVWLCVSDGVGKVTATPYDIAEHKEEAKIAETTFMKSVEDRLAIIESELVSIKEKQNEKSNVRNARTKSNDTD